MIYETAFVVRPDASEEVVSSIKNSLAETFKAFGAEVLVTDSWGVKTFAQPTESGLKKGAYHYFMYKGAGNLNAEIERKFRINENLVRHLIIKLGEDKHQAEIVKEYKNPNHTQAAQIDDEVTNKALVNTELTLNFCVKVTSTFVHEIMVSTFFKT